GGVAADFAGFAHEQGDGDAHVVIQANGTADDNAADQPPQVALHADSQRVDLADEAGGHGNTGQRDHHHGKHRGQVGPAPEQAAEVVQAGRVGTAVGAGDKGDDAESTEHGGDVGGQI